MIDGVKIKDLKVFRDDRGQVMHMLRRDDELFTRFGEIYFSITNPGIIKAWKKHLEKTQLFAVPRGNIKLVIFDDRPESPSKGKVEEFFLGEENYRLIRIPRGVWYGFKALGQTASMIVNCADIPHDPNEIQQMPYDSQHIPYQWENAN